MSPRKAHRLRTMTPLLCALATLAAVASGCGVPVDNSPTVLSKSAVPFNLLAPSPPSNAATSPTPSTVSVEIFLITSSDQLVPVTRDVAFPAPLTAILGAVVDGPTNAESASGLQSAVPAQTQVLAATTSGHLATIDLSGTFAQLVGQPQIDAVAQIVFTVTALPGLSEVAFELDGQQVVVPTASGVDVPIATRSEFASMAPA